MKNLIKVSFLLIVLFNSILLKSQNLVNDSTDRKEAINLYIDCDYCDIDYFKKHLTLVNYVRDRKEADVHLLITEINTGSGGTEYTMQFIGRGKYNALTDTLKFSLPPNSTDDEERKEQIKNMKIGLTPFILRTSLADKVHISFQQEETERQELIEDKWRSWVFRANVSGYSNGEDVYTNYNLWSSVRASKVTPDVKIEMSFNNNYSESIYRLSFDTITTYQRSNYGNILYAKSINEHWSAGGIGNFMNSSYQNIDLLLSVAPAVEYNLFKYSDATTKQLRFLYRLGYKYNKYIDTTIYNKLEENLYYQNLTISFGYVQPWGSIDINIYGNTYLHDFSKNNIGVNLYTNIRLFKGFSFYINGGYSQRRDQLSLRKEASSVEEILLRQKEVAKNYSYWVNFGVSYTFGSIYNNVVNPRFD